MTKTPTDEGLEQRVQGLEKEIARLKRSEASLRESENRYKTVFENAGDAIFIHDMGKIFIDVNPAGCEQTGYSREDLLRKKPKDIIPPERYRVPERIEQLLKGGSILREGLRQHRGGTVIPVELKSSIVTYAGKPAVLTISRDISERKKAEEALRESEEKYRLLIENIPSVAWVTSEQGITTFISPNVEKIYGHSQENVYEGGDSAWLEKIHPDDVEMVREAFKKMFSKRQKFDVEYRIQRKDGEWIWLHDMAVMAFKKDNVRYAYGVFSDISERKRAEEALQKERDRAQKYLETAGALILVLNSRGEVTLVNRVGCEILGYNEDEIIGKNFVVSFLPENLRDEIRAEFQRLIDRQIEVPKGYYENPVLTKGDQERTIVWRNRLLYDGAGNYEGLLASGVDITERKRVEKALQREKERFRILVEESPLGISLIGEGGHYEYLNPKFTEILGYTLEDTPTGSDWFEKAYPDRQYRHQVISTWINDLKDHGVGEARPRTYTVTCKDGSEKIIHFKPVSMETGEQFVIYEDITEQKRLESQLRQAQKMEAIGTLAGGIAHDFNNILQSIILNTEMALYDYSAGSFDPDRLKEALKASERATDLVKQILTFSRQSEKELRPVQISLILKEALKMMRSSLPTTIEIKRNIEAKKDMVLADPTQIHQVMMNLCTNAAHAMREKGGVLEVGLRDEYFDSEAEAKYHGLIPGAYVRLTVSDTGHGMDQLTIQRIFDPFFTTKGRSEGTGMGLAVVHGILKSFGGTISVSSDPGRGTTFEVFLPRIEGEVTPEKKVVKPLPRGKERILIVDDERSLVDSMREVLESLGYEVIATDSSIEALEVFRSQPEKFDLVITDQTMPNMTGAELAMELIRIRPEIPIILCTGFSETISEQRAKAIGVREFVMKPILMRQIAEAIRRALEQGIE